MKSDVDKSVNLALGLSSSKMALAKRIYTILTIPRRWRAQVAVVWALRLCRLGIFVSSWCASIPSDTTVIHPGRVSDVVAKT